MDSRYIVGYIHSRGSKRARERILQYPDGHEFIPSSAISISYLANVSSCLADVLSERASERANLGFVSESVLLPSSLRG